MHRVVSGVELKGWRTILRFRVSNTLCHGGPERKSIKLVELFCQLFSLLFSRRQEPVLHFIAPVVKLFWA